MCRFRACFTILFVGFCCTAFAESPSEQEDRERQKLRADILSAKNGAEAGKAYQRYFKRLTGWPRGLEDLKGDPDNSIAIQAAYHYQVVLDPDWDEGGPRRGPGYLKPTDAARFFGFLEGRTGVSIPRWWQRGDRFPDMHAPFVQGDYWDLSHPPEVHELPDNLDIRDRWRFNVSEFITAEKTDVGVRLFENGRSLTLTRELFESLADKYQLSSSDSLIRFHDEGAALTFYDFLGSPQPLLWFDKSGKLKWQTEVWALGRYYGGGSGSWPMRAELSVTEGSEPKVVTWGAGVFGHYVEEFDVATGKPEFRFSTNYWHTWNEQ